MLNVVKGHHLSLRAWFALLCNFHWFIIKASIVYHPVIQRELQELLAKGQLNHQVVELVTIPMGVVVPKWLGGLQPILNLE